MVQFSSKTLSPTVVVVRVQGSLAEHSQDQFFECIGQLVDDGVTDIIVDCGPLQMISGSGLLGLLRARAKACSNGSRICLTRLNLKLASALEKTPLGRMLAVFPSVETAIENVNRAADYG